MTSGLGSISLDPDHAAALAPAARSTRRATSAPISGVSGAPAHSTSCAAGSNVARRLEQVRDALLAGDPPDEDDRRLGRVDAVALEHVGARVGRVLLGVDPVVDDVHAVRVDRRIGGEDVARACRRETAITASAPRAPSARRSSTARSRRRAAPPSTAAAARASARSRRAGCRSTSLARWPPRFAYQVWLWTRSAPSRAGGHRQVDRHRAQRGQVRRVAGQRVPRAVARPAAPSPASAPQRGRSTSSSARELARQVLDVHARRRRRPPAGTRG